MRSRSVKLYVCLILMSLEAHATLNSTNIVPQSFPPDEMAVSKLYSVLSL